LVCLGALNRSDVGLDRDGMLDDPDYIAGLSPVDRERYNRRNVFPFSLAVAGHEVLHVIGMIARSQRVSGIGPQHYRAYPGDMAVAATTRCDPDCETRELEATALSMADQFDELPRQAGDAPLL
jgi:molybdopterin-synthase adenylyltransferase